VVLVITLLGVILLGGLVIWVLNLGDQVNRRVGAQHAADASARAAAGWAARSFNTIAANNTNMARYLALVNALEAMPQATRYSLHESTALTERLDEQIAVGFGSGLGGRADGQLRAIVTDYFEDLHAEMVGDLNQLIPVADSLGNFDPTSVTRWAEGGSLWLALEAMDDLNQTTVDGLGETLREAGVSGALANLPAGEQRDGEAHAIVLPFNAAVDAQRGAFDDFLYPVVYGRLPLGIDDPIVARGPFDALFAWRDEVYETLPPSTPTNTNATPRPGSSPGNPLSRRGGRLGGSNHQHQLVGYMTYGPQTRLLRDLRGQINDLMRTTRYDKYMRVLSNAVRSHVWPTLPLNMTLPPNTHTHRAGDDRQLRDPVGRFVDPNSPNTSTNATIAPDWRTDYDEAVSISRAGAPIIQETAWFIVEIKSRYAVDDPRFLTPGSWALERNYGGAGYDNPRVSIVAGWQSPDSRRGGWGGAQWLTDHVWRANWIDWTRSDTDIGIPPVYESVTLPDGTRTDRLVWQEVYRIDTFVFGGVNVGEPSDVPNPYDGFDPLDEDAPAPMNLVGAFDTPRPIDEPDSITAGARLSLLAVARRPDTPQAWGERFRGGRPDPSVVAIAQAKVFNNHSLDLWTQQWRAELEPVSDYEAWLGYLGDGDWPEDLDGDQIEGLRDYLVNARDLAGLLLEH
jgi:hypothetical protein